MEGTENADPQLMMEEVLEMLKLLDYENKFCKNKGFKPVSRCHFSVQSANPSEQFIYFVSLVSWLLSVNNHQVTGWNKYEDPMTASQNIILELKKLGIELDMAPNKLKNGYGDGVCTVLMSLCSISIQNKFNFRKHEIKDEGQGFGDDGDDDMGDEFEGNADIADMNTGKGKGEESEDNIDEDLDFGVG